MSTAMIPPGKLFSDSLGKPPAPISDLICLVVCLGNMLAGYIPAEAIGGQRSGFIFLVVRGCACSGLEGRGRPLWGCTVGHCLSSL